MRGHIRKRGKTWSVVVDVGYDENGKRIRKWFGGYKTKKDAETFLAKKIAEIESGSFVATSKQRLGQYMKEWMFSKETELRGDTVASYNWLVKGHIIPKIGNIELPKLTPQHVQTFYRCLQEGEEPLSNRSVRYAHAILHQALDQAVQWGLIPRNVTEAVHVPRIEKRNLKFGRKSRCKNFLISHFILCIVAIGLHFLLQ